MSDIMAGAEPFYLPAAQLPAQPAGAPRRAALLLHGFTATPHQLRDLGGYLAARGIAVLAPRLAGHATSPGDLRHATWRDWYHSALDGYFLLAPHVDQVWAVGLSLGALLALHVARHEAAAGVVALSTPLVLRHQCRVRLAAALPLRYLHKHLTPSADPDLARYISYPVYPVAGLVEMAALQEIVRHDLPEVTAPVLLVHSRIDAIAPPANVGLINGLLGSRDKSVCWLPNSDHVCTMGAPRFGVFEQVYAFIASR